MTEEQPQQVQITLSRGQKNALTIVGSLILVALIVFTLGELSSCMADGKYGDLGG